MKKYGSFILLLQFNLIVLSGTCQVSNPDTIKSYGVHELRAIADTLLKGDECKKLLTKANEQLANRDFVIKEQEKETRSALAESQLKESIIAGVKKDNDSLKLQLKLETRKLKWTKMGWITTTIGLVLGGSYLLFH